MLAVLLNNKANIDADWFYLTLGLVAIFYLVYRKLKSWSDNNPANWASLLDKWGFHAQAKRIWDKLTPPQLPEEPKEHLSIAH